MGIDLDKLLNHPEKEEEISYTKRDTMLYALSLGLGSDPLDKNQLRFVWEKDLQPLPTMSVAIGHPGFWITQANLVPERIVHGEKRIEIHKPMPVEGTIVTRSKVTGCVDKGAGKGALIYTERDVWDKASGDLICHQINTIFGRGQGGFGGPSGPIKPRHDMPDRAPDAVCDLATSTQIALIYRLMGDYHALHVDPDLAQAQGFPQPILHGLGTMGVCGHAVIKETCGYDPTAIKAMEVRFTSPLLPGDTIRTHIWKDGNSISFEATVPERDNAKVISNGLAELA